MSFPSRGDLNLCPQSLSPSLYTPHDTECVCIHLNMWVRADLPMGFPPPETECYFGVYYTFSVSTSFAKICMFVHMFALFGRIWDVALKGSSFCEFKGADCCVRTYPLALTQTNDI